MQAESKGKKENVLMKGKRLCLLCVLPALCLIMAFGALLTMTGCGQKAEYSVTVLGEDEITPVENVTVTWSQSGKKKASAKTDADGLATAEIVAATYEITLSDLPEGMTYTPAEVTSSERELTMVIEKAELTYSVTVNKPDGAPAGNVTVTWTANGVNSTATTDADGKASVKLYYGTYDVTISDLPEGYVYLGSKQVTGRAPDATFTLEEGETTEYTVTVVSEGGLKFKEYTVNAYRGESLAASAQTDGNGQVTFKLPVENTYKIAVQNIPKGYEAKTETVVDDDNTTATITLYSEIIKTDPASNTRYYIGDIFHDYTFTTPYEVDGNKKTYNISDLLYKENKRALIINFWGTQCSACIAEMDAMQTAYDKYKDDVEFLAISNYRTASGVDSASAIINHRGDKYTFPMFQDPYNFTSKFALTAWPTTVVIDKYGAIARIEVGALTVSTYWEKIIEQYISDEYTQTFIPGGNSSSIIEDMAKPDFKVDADHYEKVGEAVNSAELSANSVIWYGEPEATAEYTWPFILGNIDGEGNLAAEGEEGETVLYPSNTDRHNTFSFIYADVTMQAGQVLAFDFRCQTEPEHDTFTVFFDGKVVYTASGDSEGWQTCYVYVNLTDGVHKLALCYLKDSSRSMGFDNVYIRNVRFTDVEAIRQDGQEINMRRGAAYGGRTENGRYSKYAEAEKKNDGYYYVKLDRLENPQYAGNDSSPMLFANLTEKTNWGFAYKGETVYRSVQEIVNVTYDEGGYVFDMKFTANGVTKDWRPYFLDLMTLAGNSDLEGLLPVDDELKDLLTAFTAHISGKNYDNQWLELCYFFSHYGEGEPFGNPIIGLSDKTAIKAEEDVKITADLTKIMAPYPSRRYTFTPAKSGVYRIQSFIPDKDAEQYGSQISIYTADIDRSEYYSGSERINRTGENEQNFDAKVYLEEGKTYYLSVAFTSSGVMGELDFKISYSGESAKYYAPCASNDYVINEAGRMELSYKVEYGRDEDGYYRIKNSDGSLGEYIYIDFKYPPMCNDYPLSVIINQYIPAPQAGDNELFKVFNFTKTYVYVTYSIDADGNRIYDWAEDNPAKYDPDPAHKDGYYIDYTDTMQAYCEKALKTENDGLLKVNDELVKILRIYYLLRTESIKDGVMPNPDPDEWLQFCWYEKTVDENNCF